MTTMRRVLLIGLLVVVPVLVAAQQAYLAFEQITVAGTAIGFTAATVNGSDAQATVAMCRLRTAEISYRFDGGTPTSSVGTLLEVGDTLTLTGHDVLLKFLAIRTTGTSGQLDCTYSSR
jgi:hypothetical protein